MEFGIFDHLDRYDIPLRDFYAERLRLAELYDSAGFYSYHLAEHHATPLGMAPSPSVFLAAVAERTRRLRFGPMVYALPLYHPLRLVEEICMLDQMSGGRLDIGFGRGASPIELEIFGQDPDKAEAVYREDLGLGGSLSRAQVHPDNVWSLRGLNDCLSARGADGTAEGRLIAQRLTLAESRADRSVAASCFCARAAE